MVAFDKLDKHFRQAVDLLTFYNEYGEKAFRYLLVRSLDKENLKELLGRTRDDTFYNFYTKLFDRGITNDEIIKYIKKQYPKLDAKRKKEEIYLHSIIQNYPEVNCGIRNDNINNIVQNLVRDKHTESFAQLEHKIDDEVLPKVKQYILWSYFNQATNDLIERFFHTHDKVVPTLRRIPNVDFFIEFNTRLIPFDLKVTHISNEFFDLYSQGLQETTDSLEDTFTLVQNNSGEKELSVIKNFYASKKRELNLPNYGSLSKNQLIEILKHQQGKDAEIKNFLQDIFGKRKQMTAQLNKDLKKLAWWNYKYQGARLFCNNNRFFIFLAYTNSFEDARPLKGNLDVISRSIGRTLDTLTCKDFHKVRYKYNGDETLYGTYEATALSVLITAQR